ncbi:MAG: LPS export ABC transporter periplasmic protein LptC [Rhodospirillales bacterium]|nr:LPS export ABC transporter periplasmic protein LptC [Alphaproteobacteria bacterium]MCB9981944.1 LPS export ABC transporter periplasmic protein LptC [Rhodospirillales bacterium]
MDNIPQNNNQDHEANANQPVKFSQLTRAESSRNHEGMQRYSAFIRSLGIALPLIAIAITAIVFSWDILKPNDITTVPDIKTAKTIGKNELLNPKFDSVDNKNQPFHITARRALQDQNDALMLLDEPMADITLNNGNWLAITARQGAYRQETQRLLLKDNVTLFHDAGYKITTQELDVDMNVGTAQTETSISGHGPLGTLNAKGMHADSKAQTLIFTGPVKLVIYDTKTSAAAKVPKP